MQYLPLTANGGQNDLSQTTSYQTPVVLGLAPVTKFMVPGKESDGAEVKASEYSYPVWRSFAILDWGRKATYLVTSLLWKPSTLKTATYL